MKMNIPSKVLSDEAKEDIGLSGFQRNYNEKLKADAKDIYKLFSITAKQPLNFKLRGCLYKFF